MLNFSKYCCNSAAVEIKRAAIRLLHFWSDKNSFVGDPADTSSRE
jgi:hypothetical protein